MVHTWVGGDAVVVEEGCHKAVQRGQPRLKHIDRVHCQYSHNAHSVAVAQTKHMHTTHMVRSLVRALLGPLLLDVKCPADQGSGAVGHGETKILPLPLKMRLVVVVNELALHSVVAACEHACTSHTARSDERQREYETVQTRGSLLQWCLCCLHIRLGSIAPQHVVGAVHCMPCALKASAINYFRLTNRGRRDGRQPGSTSDQQRHRG
jgi:hypothetical protein